MSAHNRPTQVPEASLFRVGPWVTVGLEGSAPATHDTFGCELSPAAAGTAADLLLRTPVEWPSSYGMRYLGRHGGYDAEHLYLFDRKGERLAVGDGRWALGADPTYLSGPSEPHEAQRLRSNPQRPTPPAVVWYVSPAFDPRQLLAWVERWARVKALERGGVWVHGAAVEWQGEGWLFPAWGGTGKTDLLGAVLRAGGRYYADDWAALGQDGLLHPVVRRLNLLPDNWRHWPEWRRGAGAAARGGHLLARGARLAPGALRRRAVRMAEGRLRARLAATALFPHAAATGAVPLRRVALLVSGDRLGVSIERCEARALIPRILACHAVERRMPLDLGALVRFARPELSAGRDGAENALESEGLVTAIAGAEACVVTLGPGSDPNAVWKRLVSSDA